MNFNELKAELFDRGTNYLDEDAAGQARVERWLNIAYRLILNVHSWPFLQTNATGAEGAGFVSVPDLRKLLIVSDVEGTDGLAPGIKLTRTTIEELVDRGENLALTGVPEEYYVLDGTQVRSFPLGGTIRVDYVRRVAPLSGTDVPVFDEEYHNLIVDRAMMMAYVDSDNFEARSALKEEYDDNLRAMAEDYQLDSREVNYLTPTGGDL